MTIQQEKKYTILISILAIIGIVFPTSFSGVITDPIYFIAYAFFIIVFLFLSKKIDKKIVIVFMLINLSIWIYTTFASTVFFEFSFGIYINFLFLSFLYFLDFKYFKNIKNVKFTTRILLFLSTFLIILGLGVISENLIMKTFIRNYYSASYDELVVGMLSRNKPVGTFATHSVAGYFSFLFLYLNFKTYSVLKTNINLVFTFLFLLILFKLNSNTSYVFFFISLFIIINGTAKSKYSGIMYTFFILLILLILLNTDFSKISFFQVTESEKNGLSARYSGETPLKATFNYISENPFLAIGLTKPRDLYFSDSGFILYFLRGSLFLLIGVYYGFYNFLKRNMKDHKIMLFIFLITMAFEIGYPILINIRFLFFIPFVIVYLNYLKLYQDDKS